MVTVNNPFWHDELAEVDITTTTLPLALDHYNLSYLKEHQEYFNFKYIEWNFTENDKTVVKVIERPYFKDAKAFADYTQNLEHFKYTIFQTEKGENETEHIQCFLIFTVSKWFDTIKKYFPTANIQATLGTNVQARDYCSKTETRVGEVYELGQFAEERARTDNAQFLEFIDSGANNNELKKLFPALFLKTYTNIDKMRQENIFEDYKKKFRNIETTYIYGGTGVGKTLHIYNTYGFDIYRVTNYGSHPFDQYSGEDIITFEEFDSSFKITEMLNYLDRYPLMLPCRFNDKVACYTKVFIISNKSIKEQYPNIQNEKMEQYKALMRRTHNIAQMDKNGNLIYEKKDGKEVHNIEMIRLSPEEEKDLPF
jgi:hypothetical protein